MNSIIFLEDAWKEYLYWQQNDKEKIERINELLRDIARNKFKGIGKPEPLKHDKSGWWSRRIDDTNRLVYRLKGENDIEIAECKSHYSKK